MDLIDRQAILKHIEKIRQGALMMDDLHRQSIIMNGMLLCEEAVRNQPSAQPELIRCKDCKYSEYDRLCDVMRCTYNGKAEIVHGEHYCGYADMRGDRNDQKRNHQRT